MRFLCEQCKAKYQIADEKVAGKTVRMKCRKCGHLIEVKAEVTETSVSTKAPQPDAPEENDATRVGVDINAMMKLSSGATTKPASPAAPGAPRPAPAAPRPALATSLASAKPRTPSRPPQQSSALAGAFQKSVAKDDERAMVEISTSSEWYVAINGVPVGPVRISELRRKASVGAVNEESLVWQEGMEEWRPLRTIPELVAILHEGLSAERPSLVTPAPNPASAPKPAPPRAAPATRPDPSRSAPTAPAARDRNNVVSLASRLATAEKLEPEEIADPFAIKPVAPTGIEPQSDPFKPAVVAAPLDAPAAAAAVPTAAAPTVVIPRKQGPNWVVIGMVVAFGAFGATAGVAVFFRQPPQAQPAPTVIVTTQTPAATNNATTGVVAAVGTDVAPVQSGADPSVARPQSAGGSRPVVAAAGATSSGRTVDPSIAALLGGANTGPSINGGGASGGSSVALSEQAIQQTVQQRSAGVKRTCWERGGGTESNVNVKVRLTIAATGNVQSASAEGNDPIVAKCIENSVKNWQFPVSSGSSTVEIPFHFLRQ